VPPTNALILSNNLPPVSDNNAKFFVKPTVDFHRLTYISIITNKDILPFKSKQFNGFAPLQKPETSINLKGLNLSGKRVIESTDN